jgi:hypothetical protein
MTKIKRKNSELSRPFSTILVNWFITCAVLFYPTLCASVFLNFFTFLLTICVSALFISYFVTYVVKLRDTHTARLLTIFATGVVWYTVFSYAFFYGM